MSWECPYQSGPDDYCDRRKDVCKPMDKGCVLHGKGELVGAEQAEKAKNTEPPKRAKPPLTTTKPEREG